MYCLLLWEGEAMLGIGIVGYGVVGEATVRLLREKQNISILDPEIGHADDITNCDIIFICINEKSHTMENLNKLVDQIVIRNKKALIVIRTTVIPGTTDRLTKRHKREFVFMPEFLREWNAKDDALNPDKIVIGTENEHNYEMLKALFQQITPGKIIQVKPIEAELAKVALNSLALIKVVFAEELYDLTETLSADYENIYKIFKLDQNINERHLTPKKDDYRGADGKCLSKDTDFLIQLGKKKSRMALLETAQILNNLFLKTKQ